MGTEAEETGEIAALQVEAEQLAEALDAFRERLIEVDANDVVVAAWRDAAVVAWDAVARMGGDDDA